MQSNESILEALKSGKLKGATELNLQAHNLSTVPEELFALADTLEILSLNNNQLTSLPDDFKRLEKLRILFCSNNPFTVFPQVLGQCPALEMIGFKACQIKHIPSDSFPPQLRWLILTNNQIEAIPESIGTCPRMQKLMLAGNQLSTLPQSLANCSHLELLRISANNFEAIPNWLFKLPKLAWLALAGNPVNLPLEQSTLGNHRLTPVPWKHLTLNQRLGEGASGEIYHADWHSESDQHDAVALKVFKGEMTSDGLPLSELAAAVAAGSHPNLTSTIGIVEDHPDHKQATLMALLDPSFNVLAGPPSFASCTRDVYSKAFTLSMNQAYDIASQIAGAVAHLHQQGLIHGDLYAHNILLNDQHQALLSDFGGAAFVPKDGKTPTNAQRIEMRAFGILVEELLAHVAVNSFSESESRQYEQLNTIKRQCLDDNPDARPLMSEVVRHLGA